MALVTCSREGLPESRQLVLKNTFLVEEHAAVPSRPRACSDSFINVCEDIPKGDKLNASLIDAETEMGSEDTLTEFPLTDDESSCSYELPHADFERAAKENVRLLRERMTKSRSGPTSSASSSSSSSTNTTSSSSSSSSRSCGGAQPMPMAMMGASGFYPNSALMQPMFSLFVLDPSKQATSQEESGGRKRNQRTKASKQEEQSKQSEAMRTTVMLRNLPREFSRAALLKLLDDSGFAGKYNFLYMPIDFVRQVCLGYSFINLVTPDVVNEFWEAFDGFSAWPVACEKVCRVNWSSPHQGYEEHVQRYRNSPLMHQDVPDECRPVLLENGVQVNFPPPTKALRAPRLRAAKQRCPFWDQEQPETFDGEQVGENADF